MDYIFAIGITAAVFTTSAFLPQVIKTHKTRHTKDISMAMLVIFAFGLSLWSVYGIFLGEIPIIAANLITLMLVMYLLAMKIRHG